MPDPPVLAEFVKQQFAALDLEGKSILVTAGPTREPIDPVDHHPDFQSFEHVTKRSSDLRKRIERHGYRAHYADEVNTIFSRMS